MIGVQEERAGADRRHPRGQPVQAVDEVDRVDGDDGEQDRDRDGDVAAQDHRPVVAPRDVDVGQLDATAGDHQPGGEHLPGELGQRVQLVAVVQGTDEADQRGGRDDPRNLRTLLEGLTQGG